MLTKLAVANVLSISSPTVSRRAGIRRFIGLEGQSKESFSPHNDKEEDCADDLKLMRDGVVGLGFERVDICD